MTALRHPLLAAALLLGLAGCEGNASDEGAIIPGESGDKAGFAGIASDETIHFAGTEPFWGGQSAGTTLTYSTPEQPEGIAITIERFAGRGGMSLSGELSGAPFVLAVTPGTCSDGMSDRTYPLTVTLKVEGGQRQGCAWTDAQPASGPDNP